MVGVPGIRRDRVAWATFGLAVTAVVAFVVYSFLGAVLLGVFLYYATRPVRNRLAGTFSRSSVNATISLLAVAVPLLLVLSYASVVGVRELNQFLQDYQLEQYRALLEPYVAVPTPAQPGAAVGFLRDNAGQLLTYAGDLFLWAGRLFVGVVVAFYLLRDDDAVAEWFHRSFGGKPDVVAFFEGVDADLDTVYTGNLLTVAITGLIAAVTFYSFDLLAPGDPTIRYPLLLGLLVAVFTFFPAVGMKAVWVPYAAFLFVRSLAWNQLPLWVPVGFVVVTAVVVDFLPDVFVRSYVSKGDINMGLMLLAYVLGVIVFGWYGLFLGPLVLVVFLHFADRVFPNLVDGGSAGLVDE